MIGFIREQLPLYSDLRLCRRMAEPPAFRPAKFDSFEAA
jgi:hypothetical protein